MVEEDRSLAVLSEFVALPTRLVSSPLYQTPRTMDDDIATVSIHGRGRHMPPPSPSSRLTAAAAASDRRSTTYYNHWKLTPRPADAAARQRSLDNASRDKDGCKT